MSGPVDDVLVKELVRLIRMLKPQKMHALTRALTGTDLDRPALDILVVVRDNQPLRIGAIAEHLQVEGPHVTRHVAALERRGFLERVQDPDDRRAWLIKLTPSGAQVAGLCFQVISQWFTAPTADWPEQDRADFTRLLKRFADEIECRQRTVFGTTGAR